MSRLTKQEKQIVMDLLQNEADEILQWCEPNCKCQECVSEKKKSDEVRSIIAKLKGGKA